MLKKISLSFEIHYSMFSHLRFTRLKGERNGY